MKLGLVAGIIGFGILAAMTIGGLGAFVSETADFTFPTTDGKGTMSHRCEVAQTREDSERNALAAHVFFEAAIIKSARLQAEAMLASMSQDRAPSVVAAELEIINDGAEKLRKERHREIQNQFGCINTGST